MKTNNKWYYLEKKIKEKGENIINKTLDEQPIDAYVKTTKIL